MVLSQGPSLLGPAEQSRRDGRQFAGGVLGFDQLPAPGPRRIECGTGKLEAPRAHDRAVAQEPDVEPTTDIRDHEFSISLNLPAKQQDFDIHVIDQQSAKRLPGRDPVTRWIWLVEANGFVR